MRRMSGQRLAGILEWTPIFKRAHKRYKQAAGRSNHPPAHEMEFELWPREREAFVRVCRRASRRRRRRRCLIGHVCGRVSIDTSTKFANWKRRLIRWIRDFRFYDLIGVYKSTSYVCLCVCVCVKEGSLNLVNRRFGCGSRKEFFSPSLRWEVYCFEFDRNDLIVHWVLLKFCTWSSMFLRSVYFLSSIRIYGIIKDNV